MLLVQEKFMYLSSIIWSWPLLIGFIVMGIFITVYLYGIQIRYFVHAWKILLTGAKSDSSSKAGTITPFQAFINALGNSIGNGSIAGVATAVAAGGPGAAFWMVIAGILLMSIRYAEVYLGLTVKQTRSDSSLGGPMAYLARLPFGKSVLPYVYGVGCLVFGLLGGNAMQCNSMALGIQKTFNIDIFVIAIIFTIFLVYILVGGAERVLKVSDRLVPFKVGTFLLSAVIVFIYYIKNFIPALQIIFEAAFTPAAVSGSLLGIGLRDAMRKGFTRAINASEAGTGTAAVLYGAAGSKHPVRDSILSMLSVFIGVDIICFLIALLIVMSGAWTSGFTSTPLMIAAYQGVFGKFAAYIVTFCSVSFGIGLLVTYAFIGRQCWMYVTGNRYSTGYIIVYCATAFIGSVASVDIVWASLEIINALMLILNMVGVIYLLNGVRKDLSVYQQG